MPESNKGRYLCWDKPGHEACWLHNIMAPIEELAAQILAEHNQYDIVRRNG